MAYHIFRHYYRFLHQDDGNTVTEYAVMLSLIVLCSIAAIAALGDKINQIFQRAAQIE